MNTLSVWVFLFTLLVFGLVNPCLMCITIGDFEKRLGFSSMHDEKERRPRMSIIFSFFVTLTRGIKAGKGTRVQSKMERERKAQTHTLQRRASTSWFLLVA